MMTEMERATAEEIAKAVRSGRTTARAVTEAALSRISATNEAFNAFTLVTAERALEESDRVDAEIAAGRDAGFLAGVPYAVKNLFDLAGEVTIAGSKINRDNPPAVNDATAVERLKSAGAICVGALNMGEYAYDFITNNPHDGPTRNPLDLNRSAGGSSGGSGAAVCAGLVPFALGTDTNGSIRVPASFCGIWGLRPTYGGLSRAGTFAFVDSLDTIGPLGRSVDDLAMVYNALCGPDPRDPACSKRLPERLGRPATESFASLRIARLGGYFRTGGEGAVHEAVDVVCDALGVNLEIELPEVELARTAAYIITASESANRHAGRLRERAHDFDPVIRDRLLSGAMIPSVWSLQAHRFRAWWKSRLAALFETVDVLIAPATPIRAPLFGQESFTFNGTEIPLRPNIGLFTQPVSLVGLPIVAAPVRSSNGLPCAVQLIAAPWKEPELIRVARALEQSKVCAASLVVPDAVAAGGPK